MLEELYFEECLFDHPYLLTLHEFIKTLTFNNENVCKQVIRQIGQWKRDFEEITSHVFLVNSIKQYISESELDYINMLTDEIKIKSL